MSMQDRLVVKSHLNERSERKARTKMTSAPIPLKLTAVPMTRIMTTPKGSGMKPMRRETRSEWSDKAWERASLFNFIRLELLHGYIAIEPNLKEYKGGKNPDCTEGVPWIGNGTHGNSTNEKTTCFSVNKGTLAEMLSYKDGSLIKRKIIASLLFLPISHIRATVRLRRKEKPLGSRFILLVQYARS